MAAKAFVDETGRFHCPCGATHDRGGMKGNQAVYRCLACGKFWQVEGTVALRPASPGAAKPCVAERSRGRSERGRVPRE
jgi:transposase-like protein